MNFLKQTFNQFSTDGCPTLAAAVAYYTAFALPPLLYLLLNILTFAMSVMYDDDVARSRAERILQSQTSQLIGNPSANDAIAAMLDNSEKSSGKWWKTLLSLGGIAFGATGVVAALQRSLNQVWEVRPDPERSGIKDFIGKRILSLGMILGLGFLLLVSLIVSSVLAALGDRVGEFIGLSGTIASVVDFTVQALVVFIVFAAIFKIMPDAEVQWGDVLVGAAITTVLFLAGRFAMQLFFSFSEPGAALGAAAASIAVLLVWVYYSAMIVLLGAEATQVYATRFGKGIRPEPNAVRVEERIHRPGQ